MPRSRYILSDVDRPPDTSSLVECEHTQRASAIECLRLRMLRARAGIVHAHAGSVRSDRLLAALRRLESPHVAAYQRDADVLISEPFNAVPCVVEPAAVALAEPIVRSMLGAAPPRVMVNALRLFGDAALRRAEAAGVRIGIVPQGGRVAHYSDAVAKLVPGIDAWPSPPSGLFVVEERRVLLRAKPMAMTIAHEFAHALDAILARRPRSYFSYEDESVRRCFAESTGFVNEYAASAPDEYFAESVRAYLEVNDGRCAWLPLTRRLLRERDQRMFAAIEHVFSGDLWAR